MKDDLTSHFAEFLYDQGDRIGLLKQVLRQLGNPDTNYSIIHVCGTNGKGSTATMIAALLQKMGQQVGLFTSPFIGDVTNSIRINQQAIQMTHFNHYLNRLQQLMASFGDGKQELSEFEAQFVTAMQYFSDQGVDYVVLECGLGGELDATNAVTTTMYSIFTKIGMDHIGILGNTIEEIATTKSKIIRKGNTTITAPNQRPQVSAILSHEAIEKNAAFLDANQVQIDQQSDDRTSLHYQFNDRAGHFKFGLQGAYQVENVRTVLLWLFDFQKHQRSTIDTDRLLTQALGKLSVTGRFETISTKPIIMIDGAHNVDAISAFVQSVKQSFPKQPKLIITGFLKDKDYVDNVRLLAQIPNATFRLTQPDNPERKLDKDHLQTVFKNVTEKRYPTFRNPIVALKNSMAEASENPELVILVVGSFYLINPICDYLIKTRSDSND